MDKIQDVCVETINEKYIGRIIDVEHHVMCRPSQF